MAKKEHSYYLTCHLLLFHYISVFVIGGADLSFCWRRPRRYLCDSVIVAELPLQLRSVSGALFHIRK